MRALRTLPSVVAAAAAIALSLSPARADGPDRSTPEAAYRAFLEADVAFQLEVVAFQKVEMARFQEEAMVRLASPEAGRRYSIKTADGRTEFGALASRWSVKFDGQEEEGKDLVVLSLRRIRNLGLGPGGRPSELGYPERVTYSRELGLWRIQKREISCNECNGAGRRQGEERCPTCGGRGFFEESFGRFRVLAIPSTPPDPQPPAADLSSPEKAVESYLASVRWAHARSMAGLAALFERSIQVYAPFYAADRMARMERSWAEARARGMALYATLSTGVDGVTPQGEMVAVARVWSRCKGEDGTDAEERLRLMFVRQESGEWKFKSEDPACDRCRASGRCPRHPDGDPATAECPFCGGTGQCRTCEGDGYLKGAGAGEKR